jgi:hypothetical protein
LILIESALLLLHVSLLLPFPSMLQAILSPLLSPPQPLFPIFFVAAKSNLHEHIPHDVDERATMRKQYIICQC